MSEPLLSVVIPAYNEATRLPRTLARVTEYFRQRGRPYELVVVDDGSSDDTAARAREVVGAPLTILRNETNRGKGHSVRRGMLAARGGYRLMTDADLSTPIEEVERLLEVMREGAGQGADVVIASRALPGARIEVHQSWYRENSGRAFNLMVRALAVPGIHDTQCGFKLFTAAAAEACFGLARLDGFSFDVEVLYLARKRGLRVVELPVTWRNDAATRVGTWRGFLAFLDLVRIRTNDWAGRYQTYG